MTFNPNEVGQKNGKIFGFPYETDEAELSILPIPWDVTTSYGKGTAQGPQAILEASTQLDFYHPLLKNAWECKIVMHEIDTAIENRSASLGSKVSDYIHFLESGGNANESKDYKKLLSNVLKEQENLEQTITDFYQKTKEKGSIPALLGGDHSTPLALIKAFSKDHPEMGVLQIDAHADLRKAYENFEQSHASIMYNVIEQTSIKKLIQVGIRDICQEEMDYINQHKDRITTFFDREIQASTFNGKHWGKICDEIITQLPQEVYISFDIDGLQPVYCPNTGTPVPGGLSFEQAIYLLQKVVISGKKIIGFDLCEVSPAKDNEWDANVGARILWELCVLSLMRK